MDSADTSTICWCPGAVDLTTSGDHLVDLLARTSRGCRKDCRRPMRSMTPIGRSNRLSSSIHEVCTTSSMDVQVDKTGTEVSPLQVGD